MTSNGKISRIPSIGKAFKFRNKDKDPKPPPPPPKDLPRVLSPDTLSIPPMSPVSPYHQSQFSQRHSPGPSQSTLSLVSSSAASARSQSQETRRSRIKAKASSLFTLVKRSSSKAVKSPDPERDRPSTAPQGDPGISTPWNFQHNIHVDEAFIGLPPSWSTQLAQAGFSEEEIAALQARRLNVYSGRPASPNLRINTAPPAMGVPVLGGLSPRALGSLRRQFSDASLRSSNHGHPQPTSPPPMHAVASRVLTSSPSSASMHSTRTTTTSSSKPLSPSREDHDAHVLHSANDSQSTSHEDSPAEHEKPSTPPPRRPMHVVNPPLVSSPPPAYSPYVTYTPDKKIPLGDKKSPLEEEDEPLQATPSSHRKQPSTDSVKRPTSPNHQIYIRTKRNSKLPPRLSLHKTSDSLGLDSWSAEIFSGISSSSSFNSGSPKSDQERSKSPSTNSTTPLSLWSSTSEFLRSPLPKEPVIATHKRQGSKNPPKPIIVEEDYSEEHEDDDNAPPPPTGWAEPASAARTSPSAPTPAPFREPEPETGGLSGAVAQFDGLIDKEADCRSPLLFDAALEDSDSPILPKSPTANRLDSLRLASLSEPPRSRTQPSPSLLPPPSLPPPQAPREVDRKLSSSKLAASKGSEEGDESFLHVDDGADPQDSNRFSSRSSSSTISEATVVGAEHVLVKNAAVARRASAYIVGKPELGGSKLNSPLSTQHVRPPSSPLSSHFGSEDGSASSSSPSQDRHPTPTETDSPLNYYIGSSYTPSPSRLNFVTKAPVHLLVSTSGTFGGVREEPEEDDDDHEVTLMQSDLQQYLKENGASEEVNTGAMQRPRIIINHTDTPPTITTTLSALTPGGITPATPAPRYRGWLSAVVKPLEDFIDEAIDPRDYYIDLQEIAEGESGSVYAAQLAHDKDLGKLKLEAGLVAQDRQTLASGEPVAVAIKSVAIVPSGSPKLLELERELKLMRGLLHENILSMDGLYVDLVEDTLWIRMELMERSLADVVSLVEGGLMLHERMIARFASDVVQALQFLQSHNIAHRDVRSDNLLLNMHGVVKLADFSSAVQVPPSSPLRSDVVGVAYWQAPEVRTPPYNALNVDVWALGATLWELAEAEPPFARTQQLLDRWPPLTDPKLFSPPFHDFLRQCSEPADSRPTPAKLASHPLMKNACGRSVVVQLLAQCMNIEKQQYQVEES